MQAQRVAWVWAVPFALIVLWEAVALWSAAVPTLSVVVWDMQERPVLATVVLTVWGWLTAHWFVLPRMGRAGQWGPEVVSVILSSAVATLLVFA